MAHELDFTNGRAAMFSVLETPWHRLGTLLTKAPTLDEAMEHGGLNWEVVKAKHSAHLETTIRCSNLENGFHPDECQKCGGTARVQGTKLIESTIGFSVVRLDKQTVIGTVGPQWEPLQNADAFGVLRPLLELSLIHI